MQTFKVSHLSTFARWLEDEDSGPGWLVSDINTPKTSEAMERGLAFYQTLQDCRPGMELYDVSQGEYRFVFTGEFELPVLPRIKRGVRRDREYNGISVVAQSFSFDQHCIYEHKTTERFDAERYLTSWDHRFKMDIFGANRFVWNIWEMKELPKNPRVYEVFGLHKLEAYSYPEMHGECVELARKFKSFAERYL